MARLVVTVAMGLMAVVSSPSLAAAASESGMGDDVLTGVDGSSQDGGSVSAVPDPTVAVVAQQAPVGVYDRLAACESNSHWAANTGNGYSGGLQFDDVTWTEYGGRAYAPRAYLATRGQQIAVAERLHAARGFAPWPACSRRLGLR